MASYVTQLLRLYRCSGPRQNSTRGFTLTELLVSIVMSTIIIGSLLYVVVELLGVNTREESLTQTQQDMKRALDYINADVSESVWVYADPNVVADQLTQTALANAEPVLAFWRVDPVDTSSLIDADGDCLAAIAGEECEALLVRHAAHTLVVYFQEANDPNDIWEGPRRILRYELPKYGNVATLTENTGYLDPTMNETVNNTNIGFENWQRDGATTAGNIAVLTDFVDAPTVDANGVPEPGDCPNGFIDVAGSLDNFYVCISGDATVRQNRSLLVYLRGSAFDADRIVFGPRAEASRLPVLESQVFVRGVVEEQPNFDD